MFDFCSIFVPRNNDVMILLFRLFILLLMGRAREAHILPLFYNNALKAFLRFSFNA